MLSVILLVGISVSVSSYILYLQEEEALTEEITHENLAYVKGQAAILETFVNEKVGGVSQLAELYKNTPFTGSEDEIIQQAKILAASFNTGSAVISFEDGRSYWNQTSKGYPNHKLDGDVKDKSWYQAGRRAPDVTVSEPYYDAASSVYWLTIIEKIKDGAVSVDMKLDLLADIVNNATNLPGTAAIILNSDTTILASSSSALELGKKATSYSWFASLANAAVSSESLVQDYVLNDEDKIFFAHRIHAGDKQWYFCIGVSKSVAFAKLESSATAAIVTAISAVIISMILAFVILNILYRPIIALKQTILDLSSGNGDLTQRLDVHGDDDLGLIAQGINHFIENLQKMIARDPRSKCKFTVSC